MRLLIIKLPPYFPYTIEKVIVLKPPSPPPGNEILERGIAKETWNIFLQLSCSFKSEKGGTKRKRGSETSAPVCW